MKTVDCDREQEVLDALTAQRWPERCDEDLRRHVAECALCSDVVDVAGPLLHDQDSPAPDSARIPSSAVMWWRAQMRARQEAERLAARPIAVAQVIAAVTAIVLTVALGAAFSLWLREWAAAFGYGALEGLRRVELPAALLAQGWLIPAFVVGVWLVLAPLAVYFAIPDD